MKNDELKLTVEKLIMDESPLFPEKEITYKTVIRMLEEELASTKQELANSVAAKGVELCNEIFLLEREFEGKDERGAQIKKPLTAIEKHEQRQERLKPVLDGLFAWLNEISRKRRHKAGAGGAVLSQRKAISLPLP